MPKFVKKRIREICDIANSDKTITRIRAKECEGNYPVYAATINEPFAYINYYNNDKPCLIVVNDGASGSTYIVDNEKYTIGKHITGLIPHENIDIKYLQLVSEPLFLSIAKGYGLENLPKIDIENVEIEIPVKEDGAFDIEEQQRLAGIYSEIDNQKQKLLRRIEELQTITISLFDENNTPCKKVSLNTIFDFSIPTNSGLTKSFVNSHKGTVPVYGASKNTEIPSYGHIKDNLKGIKYFDDCLTYNKDGTSGVTFYRSGHFTISEKVVPLVLFEECKDNLDYIFLKYIIECEAKKKEYTSFSGSGKATKIKFKDIQIPIPLDEDGNFDLEKQIEIANKYKQIDEIKQGLIDKINYITSISVVPNTTVDIY